jgi:CHAD domain-containing protein
MMTAARVEREREIKLDAGEDVTLDGLHDALPETQLVDHGCRELHATYYDTADLRLARWGCTVRDRDDAGWVVKVPVPRSGKTLVRDEVHINPDGDEPPREAARLVSALTRGGRLEQVAKLITERHTTELRASDVLVATLVDDLVAVEAADRPLRHFREIEVELGPDTSPESVAPLLDWLAVVGCRPATNGVPKLVRGLGDMAARPADVVVPSVSRWPTGREVVHRAIGRSVVQLMEHLPAARLGIEPEGVHQARVATRRLRSDLRTFHPLLDPTWTAQLQPELRWLGGALGRVRDDDVLIELLENFGSVEPLIEVVADERETSRQALLRALDRPEANKLLDHLVAAAHDPHTAPQADDPAPDLLRPLVRKRAARLRKTVDRLGAHPADAELHRVRIATKRCRYAVEAVAPAFGSDAAAAAAALAKLQDTLGAMNDAVVISARLADTATRVPTIGYPAGQVVGWLTARAEAGRDEWREKWKRAASKKLWRWL